MSCQDTARSALAGLETAGIRHTEFRHVVTVSGARCSPAASLRLLDQAIAEAGVFSLYVATNVCDGKCTVCRYHSRACAKRRIKAAVEQQHDNALGELWLLEKNIANFFRARTATAYLGGGTPSLATIAQLSRLRGYFDHHLSLASDAEISIETTPQNLPDLSAVQTLGINRISMGIQRLSDDWLWRVNRRHTAAQALEACAKISQSGIREWNVDLMCGFPDQTAEEFVRDLEQVLAYRPGSISIYPYEPLTQADGKLLGPPVTSLLDLYTMWQAGRECLTQAGYREGPAGWWYRADVPISEVWRDRWERQVPVIGLGEQAYTFSHSQQWTNLPRGQAYREALAAGKLPIDPDKSFCYTAEQTKYRRMAFDLKINFKTVIADGTQQFFHRLEKANLGEIEGATFHLNRYGLVVIEAIMQAIINLGLPRPA